MSLLQNSNAVTPVGGYDIDYSCRFNGADSAYLNRTSTSAGNTKTWTASFWVKRGKSTGTASAWGDQGFIAAKDGAQVCATRFTNNGVKLCILNYTSSPNDNVLKTTAVYLDPSAWYHIVYAIDTGQNIDTDRVKLFINGVQETVMDEENYPTQSTNWQMGDSGDYFIGQYSDNTNYANYYLAEFHYVDGLQLTPASFAEANEDTNQWVPIRYTGAYGTNGVFLEFKDSGALGTDTSGNGNTFTVNNLVASDQVLDSPTNNFCTMNPLYIDGDNNGNISWAEGNTKWTSTGSGGDGGGEGTIGVSSGKWYWEYYVNTISSTNGYFGAHLAGDPGYGAANFYYSSSAGTINSAGETQQTSIATVAAGDIVSIAIDLDASPQTGKVYKNNSQLGTTIDLIAGYTWTPWLYNANTSVSKTFTINCGQDSTFAAATTAGGNQDGNGIGDFKYAVPSGYLALCTKNLPEPSIALSSGHFNQLAYDDGAGAKTGVGFQPDFVWFKSRGSAYDHKFVDAVRGVTKAVMSPNQAVESTDSTGLTAFGADGFTVGADTSYSDTTGAGMFAWCWKGDGVSGGTLNENGTLDSQVNVNTTAGFSIVTYTNNNTAGATVGHGLSQAPEMIMNKTTTGTYGWFNYHIGLDATAPEDYYNNLNATSARYDSASDGWNDVAPTATVFSLGQEGTNSVGGLDVLAYCWHSVEGYSKIGKYEGNGQGDGPFVYTGFQVAWLIVKDANGSTNWRMYNNLMPPYNKETGVFYANSTSQEVSTGHPFNFHSNGVTVRGSWQDINTDGHDYIYAMFAEYPFKYSNAR